MARLAAGATEAAARLRQSERTRTEGAQAVALVEAGFRFAPGTVGLTAVTLEAIEGRAAEMRQIEREAILALAPFAQAAGRRLRTALSLLHAPGAVSRIPDAEARRARAAALWPCWRATTGAMDVAAKVGRDIAVAEALTGNLAGQKDREEAERSLRAAVEAVRRRVVALTKALGDAEAPTGGTTTRLASIVVAPPADAEPRSTLLAATQSCERLRRIYERTIGELAEHAIAVERALKLVDGDGAAG
jgi:hypothetical protein